MYRQHRIALFLTTFHHAQNDYFKDVLGYVFINVDDFIGRLDQITVVVKIGEKNDFDNSGGNEIDFGSGPLYLQCKLVSPTCRGVSDIRR